MADDKTGQAPAPITTEAEAMTALGDMLGEENEGETPNPATEEIPPSGDETGQSDTAEEPPIEPPASWSAEDKAAFQDLPRKAQEVIARREAESRAAVDRGMNEAANARKAAEAERKAVSEARAKLIEQQEAALATLYPELQKFQQIDWNKLANDDPGEYIRQDEARKAFISRIEAAQQRVNYAKQQQAHEFQTATAERMAAEREKLVAAIPEFSDPVKGRALMDGMSQWLKKIGFADEEISTIADHRTVKVVHIAYKAAKEAEARLAAAGKKTAPVARIARPGQAVDSDEVNARSIAGSMGNLKKHGTIDAAAAFLEKIL